MNRLNILIVGCGKVGCELARQLMTMKCFNVWGLRRDITRLPAGVHPIQGDLTHTNLLGEWPDRIDYAVYAAAADKGTPESYQQTYVTGLGNTLNRLKAGLYSPRRVFFTSSTSVFHQNQGEWVDEASATEPCRFNGQALLRAETLLTQSDLTTTAIRFGG
ncbi:MAG: NAD-dependent epimerase/dehydratase family protein, partial [Endozoicomonas sp.]